MIHDQGNIFGTSSKSVKLKLLHFVIIFLTLLKDTLSLQYQYDLENMYCAGNIKHEKQNCIEYAAILAHTRQFFIAPGDIC